MSVIVMGMEMPTNCALCDCSFGALCYVSPAEVNGYCPGHSRPEWCPLVELPEKHGRLKDVDAIIEDIRKNSESYFADDFAREWIDRQPTIVEAEGD